MAAIAFMALGSLGDINPLLGTARALRQRGHDVSFITTPYYEDFVAAAGVPFLPIGTKTQFTAHMANPGMWNPLRFIDVSFTAALDWLPDSYRIIERLHGRGLDIIAAQFQCFGARLGAEAFGIPMVTVMPCPILMQSRFDPVRYPLLEVLATKGQVGARLEYALINALIRSAISGGINRFRKSLGMPATRDAIAWLWSTDLHLGLWPRWMRAAQADSPPKLKITGFIEFDGEPAFGASNLDPAFLARRPIVFTPGSAMLFGTAFFAAAAKAMTEMPDAAAYFVTRYPKQLPNPLPANVRHLPFAPFATLLPQCSAIMHHGGIGTAARALRAGIPQLIVPFAFDQYDNAHLLKRAGVGDRIRRGELSGGVITRKLKSLLSSPSVAAACRQFASDDASENAVEETCRAIEGVLRPPGPPSRVARTA